MLKGCQNPFKNPFAKGILCGVIVVGLSLVSWRFVLLAAGIGALYFLLCKC